MSVETDVIRSLGRACALLAAPTRLEGSELKEVQEFAQRLGAKCGYYADHPASQTDGLAGSIRAEISILVKILTDNAPNRRGRPKKTQIPAYDALVVLPIYNAFDGSRPRAVKHLVEQGLLVLGKDDTIGKWVKYFADLNRRSDKKSG
jgi:hypothetical protein